MPKFKTNRKLGLVSAVSFLKSNLRTGTFPEQQLVNKHSLLIYRTTE